MVSDSQVEYLTSQFGEEEVEAYRMPSAWVTMTVRGKPGTIQSPSRKNENRDQGWSHRQHSGVSSGALASQTTPNEHPETLGLVELSFHSQGEWELSVEINWIARGKTANSFSIPISFSSWEHDSVTFPRFPSVAMRLSLASWNVITSDVCYK